jgi:hypothetical protein
MNCASRHRSFSFLRLGDGELRFLLEMQSRIWKDGIAAAD